MRSYILSFLLFQLTVLFSLNLKAEFNNEVLTYSCSPNEVYTKFLGEDGLELKAQKSGIDRLSLDIQVIAPIIAERRHPYVERRGYDYKRKPVFFIYGSYNRAFEDFGDKGLEKRHFDMHSMHLAGLDEVLNFSQESDTTDQPFEKMAKIFGLKQDDVLNSSYDQKTYYIGGTIAGERQMDVEDLDNTFLKIPGFEKKSLPLQPQNLMIAKVPFNFAELSSSPDQFEMQLSFIVIRAFHTQSGIDAHRYRTKIDCVRTPDIDTAELGDLLVNSKTHNPYYYDQSPPILHRKNLQEDMIEVVSLVGEVSFVPVYQIRKALEQLKDSETFENPFLVVAGGAAVAAGGAVVASRASSAGAAVLASNPVSLMLAAVSAIFIGTQADAADYCGNYKTDLGWQHFLSMTVEQQMLEVKACNELAGAVLDLQKP